jgi:hypothetical protein
MRRAPVWASAELPGCEAADLGAGYAADAGQRARSNRGRIARARSSRFPGRVEHTAEGPAMVNALATPSEAGGAGWQFADEPRSRAIGQLG